MWQVGRLTILWSVGGPQSKEQEERIHKMLEWIIRKLDKKAEEFIREIKDKYPEK